MSPTEKLATALGAVLALALVLAALVLAAEAHVSSRPARRRRPTDPALEQLAQLYDLEARRRFRRDTAA